MRLSVRGEKINGKQEGEFQMQRILPEQRCKKVRRVEQGEEGGDCINESRYKNKTYTTIHYPTSIKKHNAISVG